jgi:hypothetical protein
MVHAQRFIQMDKNARAINPYAATLARRHTLECAIKTLEASHRSLLAARDNSTSLSYNKAKLRAYYACKQQDKAKCRVAIDAFKDVATELLQRVMDGKVDSLVMYGSQQSYIGSDGKDENARQMADSMKNTVEVLEYFYDNM